MKLKNILKVLDMFNQTTDVFVRSRGDKYMPLSELKLMDFELGIYDLDRNYQLVLNEVKKGEGDENSDDFYPKLYVQLIEDDH